MASNVVANMVALFRFKNDPANRREMSKTESGFNALSRAAGVFGVALGAGAAFQGLRNFTNQLRTINLNLANTSAVLGISTDELDRWNFAGEQAGISTASLSEGFRVLQERAGEATLQGGEAAKTFSLLGVNPALKDGPELLRAVATGLNNISDRSQRAMLSQKLFGSTLGAQLIPLLSQGGDEIERMRMELDQYGGPTSAKSIQAAQSETKAFARLGRSVRGLADAFNDVLGVDFVTNAIDRLASFVTKIGELVRTTTLLKTAGLFVAGFAAKWALANRVLLTTIGRFAAVQAAWTGLFLAVDQVVGQRTGAVTKLGKFWDALSGGATIGEAMENLNAIEKIIISIAAVIDIAVSGFEQLFALFSEGIDFGAFGGLAKELLGIGPAGVASQATSNSVSNNNVSQNQSLVFNVNDTASIGTILDSNSIIKPAQQSIRDRKTSR